MKTIEKNESRERDVFAFNTSNLNIEWCLMSEMGSYSPWDVKYKRGEDWYVSNIKILKHNHNEPFDFSPWNESWKVNPIDGHPIKKGVLEGLYKIYNEETFEDKELIWGIPNNFKNYYIPTIILFFGDGIALEWDITELPIGWDPVAKSFRDKYFVPALNPNTQEDWSLRRHLFYGLPLEGAKIWNWSEPKKKR